jgi:nitrite reductase/ring-hydroxylating ferredoxin subunit
VSERVEVAPEDEFEPGERRLLSVEGRSIGVFNVDGEYFAIENRCAHDTGPVCEGQVHNALVGEYDGPGSRVRESFDGAPSIACPWHGWEYDLNTGVHLGTDDIAIRTFDVEIIDGTVCVITGTADR